MLLCLKFDSPFYVTFEQARSLGGTVRKGEKSTLVVFWKLLESLEKDGSTKKTPFLRYYNVFNFTQTEGIDPTKIPETEAYDHDFNSIQNNAAYIKSWIRTFKNDPKVLVMAAAQAQNAVNYIINQKLEPAPVAEMVL